MKIIRYFFLMLTLIWMVIIFMYSHRPGPESKQDSYKFGMIFCRVFIINYEEMSPDEQMELAYKMDHPVRKLAHFTEYFILGVFLFGAVDSKKRRIVMRWFLPWLIATLYAVSDEVHQFFIPGRNCNAWDVFIDSAGACVGVIICILVTRLANNRCQNRITN